MDVSIVILIPLQLLKLINMVNGLENMVNDMVFKKKKKKKKTKKKKKKKKKSTSSIRRRRRRSR